MLWHTHTGKKMIYKISASKTMAVAVQYCREVQNGDRGIS